MSTVLIFLCAFLWTTANAWSPYPLYENTLYDYTRPQPQYLNKSELSFNLGDPEDFRIAVYEKCRFQFDGAWKLITPQQMIFYPLRRSIRDRWYYCGLPSQLRPIYREYSEAVVIFYGPGRRHPERTNTVSAVSAYFSEKQLQQYSTLMTPRILGTFPGGRIEEYWQQFRVASNKDIPLIAEEIIRKLAYIHGLTPPAPRSIDHFWHEVSTFISIIRRAQYSQHLHKHFPKQKKILFEIQSYNFEAEALWLRSYLDEIRTPIVFSHGNPRAERILLRNVAGGDNMTFLDLGWGRYLYRGYDLADFFLEGAIILDRSLPYPHFKVDPNWVPVPKRLDELVELYLRHITPLERDWPSIENTKESLLEEMERATLLSHFYNAVHSLFNSYFDFGKMFGFPEYSRKRLEMYFLFKKQIIEQKGLKIPLFAKKFLPNDLIDRGYPGARNIGPHDRLYLDPFFISSDSISGYLYPQSFVTNGLDLELCRRMSRNSGFYSDQYPSAYSNYFEPNIGPILQNNKLVENYAVPDLPPKNLPQVNQAQNSVSLPQTNQDQISANLPQIDQPQNSITLTRVIQPKNKSHIIIVEDKYTVLAKTPNYIGSTKAENKTAHFKQAIYRDRSSFEDNRYAHYNRLAHKSHSIKGGIRSYNHLNLGQNSAGFNVRANRFSNHNQDFLNQSYENQAQINQAYLQKAQINQAHGNRVTFNNFHQQQQQLYHGAQQQQQQLYHGAHQQQQQQQQYHGAQQQQQEQTGHTSDINKREVWRHLATTYKRAPIPKTGHSDPRVGS